MSKKHLDTTSIVNELREASLFFHSPPQTEVTPVPSHIRPPSVAQDNRPDALQKTRTHEQANARTPEHPNTRTNEHPNGRTGERTISRQSYNVFTDQHRALQQRELEATLEGRKTTISDMVREALDSYLKTP